MIEKKLIESGNMKMEWGRNHMQVLAIVREKFDKENPLKELKRGGPFT
jgi:adenosylhomocysteinase